VQISQSDQYLLFQTMRGAVDVVSGEILRGLERFDDSVGSDECPLTRAELETLTRRGYVTDTSIEEEQRQGQDILQVLAEKQTVPLELFFSVPSGDRQTQPHESPDGALIAELLSLAEQITGGRSPIITQLDINGTVPNASLMDAVLRAAQAHDSLLLPRLTFAGLQGMGAWLKSENFRHIVLMTDAGNMTLDPHEVAANIIRVFEQQIHPMWKCDVDGMSTRQLEAVLSIFESVRRKYPFFKVTLLSSQLADTVTPEPLPVNGQSLPFISTDNEAVFGTLLSFILTPNRINYRPFFQLDAHKLTCDLGTNRVTYQSGASLEVVENPSAIKARVAAELAQHGAHAREASAQILGNSFCKYALVCGCQRGLRGRAEQSSEECATAYEGRLRQVIPLLLFNLQQKNSARVVNSGKL
jgi:hypothetical protein